MEIPYFYEENIIQTDNFFELSSATSNHCVRVLRMQKGENILITDGKGGLFEAVFEKADKKQSLVKIVDYQLIPAPRKKISIAISPLKNAGRMEWFLEKATEIGIKEIRLLHCERTERNYFKADRFKNILTGALIQSRQTYLPALHEPEDFKAAIVAGDYGEKLIAHCMEGEKTRLTGIADEASVQILIGPEGDFTGEEIEFALQKGYQPVSLGENRLRTETAGLVAATLLMVG